MQEPITDLTVISELISLPCSIYHTEGFRKPGIKKLGIPIYNSEVLDTACKKKNKNKKKLSKTKNQERKITKNLIIKLLIWNHLKTYLC